jgi:spoIIIJ-associated protein
MIKVISATLEKAYEEAASKLGCSVTELNIEVVQPPSNGFLGLFKKSAIIVAAKKSATIDKAQKNIVKPKEEQKPKPKEIKEEIKQKEIKPKEEKKPKEERKKENTKKIEHSFLNDTIMPESFVSTQDDEDYDMADINFTADYEDEPEEIVKESSNANEIAKIVEKELNNLFDLTCFKIDKIDVSVCEEETLLVEFKGEDAALLIGKEGYRYKALSYMIFNWINTKYKLQLRLEIAEFLKNQEESINRYLVDVYENIDRDGKAQTKILDGVLVQIALKELRAKYPDKYVAIRSTRDGLKFIIINDYRS